jgi:hypothetical protein
VNNGITRRPQAESWDFAALVLRSNRADLMYEVNLATGAPSYAVSNMQHEFVEGRMEFNETVAFAKVCLGLVDAARKRQR